MKVRDGRPKNNIPSVTIPDITKGKLKLNPPIVPPIMGQKSYQVTRPPVLENLLFRKGPIDRWPLNVKQFYHLMLA